MDPRHFASLRGRPNRIGIGRTGSLTNRIVEEEGHGL